MPEFAGAPLPFYSSGGWPGRNSRATYRATSNYFSGQLRPRRKRVPGVRSHISTLRFARYFAAEIRCAATATRPSAGSEFLFLGGPRRPPRPPVIPARIRFLSFLAFFLLICFLLFLSFSFLSFSFLLLFSFSFLLFAP